MKFTVLRDEFKELINFASRFASGRSQLPILENIVLKIKGTKVYAMSTNLELSFYGSISVKADGEGEIALPASLLSELVNKVNSERLEFEIKGEMANITAGSFKGNISGMNTSDFPVVPSKLAEKNFKVKFNDFNSAIEKVMFSVSKDDTRPVLTGVLVYFDTHYLYFVSSDGFRLSQKKLKHIEKSVISDNLIIPRTVLSEINKMKIDDEVKISYDKEQGQIIFEISDYIVSSRLIEGNFPDFNKIIPDSTKTTINVSVKGLSDVLGTAGIFAKDSANVIKLEAEDKLVKIFSESSRSGKQESEIEADVDGVFQLVSFNFRYIEEFLGVCSGSDVSIKLIDSASPGVFEDASDKEFLHIIMPVRMEES